MRSIGCPMLGDSLYAPAECKDALDRLALHAYKIKFKHPSTHEVMHLSAEIDQLNYRKWLISNT